MEDKKLTNKMEAKDSIKEEKTYCVYIHRNKLNNKCYIGQTGDKPEYRWGAKGQRYLKLDKDGEFGQSIMARAVLKYSDWDNDWEHIIFADHLTQDEANTMEIALIALYQTNCCKYNSPSFGYNMNDGGSDVSGKRNPMYGVHRFGESNPNYGNHKIAGSNNPNYGNSGARNTLSVILYCLELNEIFYGAREVERLYGIDHSRLIKVCKGERKSAGKHPETGEKLHWLYAEDAIREGYITQQDLDNYLQEIRNKGE